jgi:hypothetical protein
LAGLLIGGRAEGGDFVPHFGPGGYAAAHVVVNFVGFEIAGLHPTAGFQGCDF